MAAILGVLNDHTEMGGLQRVITGSLQGTAWVKKSLIKRSVMSN